MVTTPNTPGLHCANPLWLITAILGSDNDQPRLCYWGWRRRLTVRAHSGELHLTVRKSLCVRACWSYRDRLQKTGTSARDTSAATPASYKFDNEKDCSMEYYIESSHNISNPA